MSKSRPTPCEHACPYGGKPAMALSLEESMSLGPCPSDSEHDGPVGTIDAACQPFPLSEISEEEAQKAEEEFDAFLEHRAAHRDEENED